MKKLEYLITGGSGWLGQALLDGLIHGLKDFPDLPKLSENNFARVMLLPGDTHDFSAKFGDKIEVFYGDIRKKEDCERFFKDATGAKLIHTAGIIHPKKVSDFFEINVNGTLNLLYAANNSHITKAVILSSNSPMGCNPNNEHVFDERSPFNPYMNYGKSKMLMEKAIINFQKRASVKVTTIRAPWFYGPFQPARQTLFFEMIRDGKVPIVGDGRNMRSMVYIENLVQGVLLALQKEVSAGKVYWIADDSPYSMNEVIDTIEKVMSEKFGINCVGKRVRLPSFVSEIALFIDKMIQGLGLYNQKIHVLSEMNKNIACSVSLAKSELGYSPNVSLSEGIKRSIYWMINNGIKL